MRIEHGDMREVLGKMVAEGKTVQSVITDPPYGLAFMGKKWDAADNVAFMPGTWRLCWELLPPGGHLVAFAGTRTYHRMAVAIEEAGFEIRDTIAWLYGSGFPKSHNVSKGIDKAAGAEPIDTGIPSARHNSNGSGSGNTVGFQSGIPNITAPATDAAREWEGWGTALKPAMELICLARKPLVGTVAGNVLKHGTGALNIDGCRVGTTTQTNPSKPRAERNGFVKGFVAGTEAVEHHHGRWPANVVHDGSDEVVSAFPESTSGGGDGVRVESRNIAMSGKNYARVETGQQPPSTGSAARFFYSAKADAGDRLGSKHPTVKPVDLMRWLVRLITPPGGTVLDPFAGSGTTGMACMAEGFDCIMVEREAEYVADIKARIAHVRGDDTPLFAKPRQEVLL